MGAARPLGHDGLLRDHHADGQSRAEALGQRHDVGRDAPVLAREHLAGTPDAGLHLVEDQQDAVPVAQRPQAGEEPVRRHEVAALALDRLDQDRGDLARRHVAGEQHVLDVVEDGLALVGAGEQRPVVVRIRHVGHARHRREEPLLLGVLARGERQRAHRPAVEPAEEADEARPPGDVAGELERALDALGAGLREEAQHRLAHRRQLVHALAEAHLVLVPVVGRDVQEAAGGVGDRRDDLRVRMAGAADGDAGDEVQEAVAVDVPDLGAAAVRHHERVVARIGRRDDGRVAGEQRPGLGSGQLGLDVRSLHSRSPRPAI